MNSVSSKLFWLIQTVYTIVPLVFIVIGLISVALFKMNLDDVTFHICRFCCTPPSRSVEDVTFSSSGKRPEASIVKEKSSIPNSGANFAVKWVMLRLYLICDKYQN